MGDGGDGLLSDDVGVWEPGHTGQQRVQGIQEAPASSGCLWGQTIDNVEHIDLTQSEVNHEEEAQGDHHRGHQGHRVVCRDVEKSNPATEIEKNKPSVRCNLVWQGGIFKSSGERKENKKGIENDVKILDRTN